MSQRRPPPKPPVQEEIPEDEEEDLEEDFEDEGVDLLDALGSWFTTEEGDTVASALVGLKTAVEMQNKILIKILSAMSKPAAVKTEEATSA